jgi:hypothetical protein
MPIEYVLLKDAPILSARNVALYSARGQVQSWWRKLFRLPYCCLICEACKEIIGYVAGCRC